MSHLHPHEHGHSHHAVMPVFSNAFFWAVLINTTFVLIEAFYAHLSHSSSLLADAGHNLGDVMGLAMAWLANWLIHKKTSKKYSYGFKRSTILAALFNAILLFFVTVCIVIESTLKFWQPATVATLPMMIVASVGIVVNGGTALLFLRGQEDLNIKAAFLHLAYDALISFSVVITAVIIHVTGWLFLDAAVGLLLGLTIFYSSWRLLRNALDLILDAVPQHIDQQAIEEYLKKIPGVTDIHHLHIWGLSTREAALTVHLVAGNGISDQALKSIHQTLFTQFGVGHATLQIEGETHCH